MEGTVQDLSDEQIESLLSEAEARLSATSQPGKALKTQGEQASSPTTRSKPQPDAVLVPTEPSTGGHNLTVRVPQLLQKKKSKVSATLPVGFFFAQMMRIFQTQSNDASRYPVMGDSPAPL